MKICKKMHKLYLFNLFYEARNGQRSAKEFPLEKLLDASSAKKKLVTSTEVDERGVMNYKFEDDEIEFTPSEIVILKELFDAKKSWGVNDADIVLELKEIFNPSKTLPIES